MAGSDGIDEADRLTEEARSWLRRNLAGVSDDVASILAIVGVGIGINAVSTGRRLLESGDAEHGMRAVRALDLDGAEAAKEALSEALDHGKYHVRVAALEAMVPLASASDRSRIVGKASDPSADMRLAFAVAMEQHRWPEAIGALAELLRDERDFSMDHSATWSRFGVARAAVRALGAYEVLPKNAVRALEEAARGESSDPFVGCAAIAALAARDTEGVEKLIGESLSSSGLAETPEIRPKVQVAAWAVFDRVLAEQQMPIDEAVVRMALEDTAVVAGPLLMAIGILGGNVRLTVLDRLRRSRSTARAGTGKSSRGGGRTDGWRTTRIRGRRC